MDFRRYQQAAAHRWWLIILGTLVFTAAAYIVAGTLPRTFEASTTLLVEARSTGDAPTYSDVQLSQLLATTYIALVDLPAVRQQVLGQLGLQLTEDDLARMVSVTPVRDTQLFTVNAKATTPELARDVANVTAQVFIDQENAMAPGAAVPVTVVQPALAPGQPTAPRVSIIVGLGAAAGLGLMVLLVILLEALDTGIRTAEEGEASLGIPVLSVVGRLNEAPGVLPSCLLDPEVLPTPAGEPYRFVRSRLSAKVTGQSISSLVVVSAESGEGRTLTVANLAVAYAQGGWRVIVVDADLRNPSLHRVMNVQNQRGLVDALVRTRGDQAEVPIERLIQSGPVAGLSVITSGSHWPDPLCLFESSRFAMILGHLERLADLVILDTPPFLAFGDGRIIAQQAGASLLVVDGPRGEIRAAREVIRTIGIEGRLVGAVLNQRAPEPRWHRRQAAKPVEGFLRSWPPLTVEDHAWTTPPQVAVPHRLAEAGTDLKETYGDGSRSQVDLRAELQSVTAYLRDLSVKPVPIDAPESNHKIQGVTSL